ncbi:DUF3906 family protein [Paenibacillus sp. MWE-103]|uniref:DUF3906 family protein n=1 Tax=Paenibacillus artemisiicola TaxID=1172618 RepID=A0ABS3WIU3_9BACL|nr:DUF3906 family protein [Paenibacillus artemisiicola]MBO7748251.1 DUF3906 family protein [Paenibacillus artemisiicola]
MFLYKIEIELEDETGHLILLAETDEKAFAEVEGQLERHYVKKPALKSAAIVEKKRTSAGSGYFIPHQPL